MARESSRQSRTSSRSSSAHAKASHRSEARVSTRTSQRRGSGGVGGKELMICAGVIGILVVIVIGLYFKKSGEEADANKGKKAALARKEANEERAIEQFRAAERAALNWVQGKAGETAPDLSGLSADKVYNAVLTRRFKDTKKKRDADQVVKFNQNPATEVGRKSMVLDGKDGIALSMAEIGGKEMVLATKSYQAPADDKVNQGGEIIVIVYSVGAGEK